MSTDFSYLNDLAVTAEKTAPYPLVELGDDQKLVLRSANEGNAGYMNELLRLTGQANGSRKRAIKVDAKAMDTMREHDKVLFPEHVIVGWSGIMDVNGDEVAFSKEVAAQFISALPNWIFDGIRAFANNPENFVTTIDVVGKAKN